MNMIRAAIAAVIAALSLPMLGVFGQNAAADPGNVTTLSFFEHDTQQTTVDLGARGPGPGDQCTTLSGNDKAGDVSCTQTLDLDGGQILFQGLADSGAVFVRGEAVPVAIVGGTGIYNTARGDGTAQVPPDVPNETDANYVLNVVTG